MNEQFWGLFLGMIKAIDYFCGGGGMSYGLKTAGINVIAGIDNDPKVQSTYVANHPKTRFYLSDISQVIPAQLAHDLHIGVNDDSLVLVGCSPCQYWSLLKTDKTKSRKSAFLLEFFLSHVEFLRPGYVLIENVPGMHARDDSPLTKFKTKLSSLGYSFDDAVVNCNDYGVPQNRMRYVLLATRLGEIKLPRPIAGRRRVLRDAIGKSVFPTPISAGHQDDDSFFHRTSSLSPINMRRIRATPHDGGNRLAWKDNPELQLKAYVGRDDCFRDVYARLYWDKPAPTLTTRFISYSNGRFGHPQQDRALSVREGAAIQSFPLSYKIKSRTVSDAARIVGNAVPPKMALAIGKQILRHFHANN